MIDEATLISRSGLIGILCRLFQVPPSVRSSNIATVPVPLGGIYTHRRSYSVRNSVALADFIGLRIKVGSTPASPHHGGSSNIIQLYRSESQEVYLHLRCKALHLRNPSVYHISRIISVSSLSQTKRRETSHKPLQQAWVLHSSTCNVNPTTHRPVNSPTMGDHQ